MECMIKWNGEQDLMFQPAVEEFKKMKNLECLDISFTQIPYEQREEYKKEVYFKKPSA